MRQKRTIRPAVLLGALAAGMLIFFLAESALVRRVSPDIFLPVEAGAFLPGRLARLAASLVLGFALAMTERGRALARSASRTLDRFCGRDRGRWTLAALLTALFFLWALRVTVPSYMTMDEVSFMQAISQVPEKGMAALFNTLAHSSQENTSSISVLLCWLIGQFYRLDPDGYWYLGYHLFILFVGFTVIGRCILVKTNARRWPAWTGCAVCAVLGGGVLLYALSRIAFTVTAAVAGTASAALLLCRHHEGRRAGRVLCDALGGVLLILCCMQRRATGYSLLCFWALALVYALVQIRLSGGGKKRTGALLLCAVIVLAVIGGVFAVNPRLESDEHYRQAEYYRSLIGDYLKEDLTQDEYARAGVGPELAAMIHTWYFMDERIDTELFRELSQVYEADQTPLSPAALPARLGELTVQLAAALWEDTQMRWQTAGGVILLLLCLGAWARFGRRYLPELLCALCTAGGTAILLLYLIRDGRFPIRAFLAISIPAAVMLLLLALSVPVSAPAAGAARPAGRIYMRLAGGALAVVWALSMYAVPTAAQSVTHADVFALQNAIDRLADSNGGGLVISSMFDHLNANTDPLHPLTAYPENIIPWGYCGDLAKAPEDRLYADVFFRGDTLLLIDQPSVVLGLLQYLSMDWGPVQATEVMRLPAGATALRLEQVVPGEPDYTGWYEQNGLTYYFRDGQAVTGEQTIDGEDYVFTGAGAQSTPVLPKSAERIYTLDAYSLSDSQ